MTEDTYFPSVTDNEDTGLLEWLKGTQNKTVETVVTSAGSRWSFNNDGTSHYLEFVDVTRREPSGKFKRVYKGKIEGGHVTHKGVTSKLECTEQYARWKLTPYGRKGRGGTGGENAESAGATERRDERVALPDGEWSNARDLYIN